MPGAPEASRKGPQLSLSFAGSFFFLDRFGVSNDPKTIPKIFISSRLRGKEDPKRGISVAPEAQLLGR